MKEGKIEYSPDFLNKISEGGGYNDQSACAELVDNSLACANELKISINEDSIVFEDSGENAGMDEITLRKHFFAAGKSSTGNNGKAPGKFGLGGKTGIISLMGEVGSADVEITTHKKGSKPIYAIWEYSSKKSDTYRYDLLEDDSIPYGTKLVIQTKRHFDIIKLINFLSVVYCWAIEDGFELSINGNYISSADPFYRRNKHVIENNLFSSKTFMVKGEEVTINIVRFTDGYVIPESELHSFDKGNGKSKSVSTANRSGIFIRTEGRYYTLGNNFDKLFGGTVHSSLDGLRIEVILPKKLWKFLGITWNKGNEVKPFKEIKIFNTGDKETGVYDYILDVISNFRNNKKTTGEKAANALRKELSEFITKKEITSFSLEVIADSEQDEYISFQNNTLTCNVESHIAKDLGQHHVNGTLEALCLIIDILIKNNQSDLIAKIVSNYKKIDYAEAI